MEIDGKRLAEALGLAEPLVVHTELCRSQIAAFEAALAPGASLHVACTQEAPLFREVAAEKGEADLTFTNIRERAGWCADKPSALPKMAALLAEAAHTSRPTGVTTLKSEGVCLVYGRGQAALDVAAELSDRLSVTVLLERSGGGPAARHRLGADLQGPHPHGHRASRPLRDRGRRLRADAALLQGRARSS